jgi:hypothetical protein
MGLSLMNRLDLCQLYVLNIQYVTENTSCQAMSLLFLRVYKVVSYRRLSLCHLILSVSPYVAIFVSNNLPAHSGPWPLIQFRTHSFTGGRTLWMSDELVTRQLHKHRIIQTQNKYTHQTGIKAGEDNTCLRLRDYRYWPYVTILSYNYFNSLQLKMKKQIFRVPESISCKYTVPCFVTYATRLLVILISSCYAIQGRDNSRSKLD